MNNISWNNIRESNWPYSTKPPLKYPIVLFMSSWRGIILVPGLFYRFQLVVQNQLTEKCPAMKRSLLSVEPLVERVEQFILSPLPLYLVSTIKWGVDLAKFNSPCCGKRKMRAHGERRRRIWIIAKWRYLKGVSPSSWISAIERVEWFDFDLKCHQSSISIAFRCDLTLLRRC